MRKLVTLAALVFISFFTMNFRCQKEQNIRPFDHHFETGVVIHPVKTTYSLADTIWLETDVSGKLLFDKVSNQLILADTGNISFQASFDGFGLQLSNPPNGFCEIIAPVGVNVTQTFSSWATQGMVKDYGCGQTSYRVRIGFKPNYNGTYGLLLPNDQLVGSCPGKIVLYHAALSYKFKDASLGLAVFNDLASQENLGSDAKKHFISMISERRAFVFKVE